MFAFLRRLRARIRYRNFDREVADELAFHRDMKERELLGDGAPPDRVRDAARRAMGNELQAREQARSVWIAPRLEDICQDARHALRLMRRDPAFTFTALATLALGIGLNAAVFSVAYGVLWRPLPYPDPDRLVVLSAAQQTDTGARTFWTWAPVSYEGLRQRVTTLEHLAAYSSTDAQVTGIGEPLQVPALDVSPNFFATLGVTPARGRAFLTGAAAPDDDRSAIVSDRFWRTALRGDPAAIGHAVTIDGLPRTVVGVLPPGFGFKPVIRTGALREVDIFLPDRWPGDPGTGAFLFLLGRLKPGATRERAEVELTALANDRSIAAAGALAPEGVRAPDARTLARAVGLRDYGTQSVRPLLLILLGAVSFVLLVACVDVANLQMARLTARRGELSVRMALGAGRRRIVRQLATEAVVLSALGASLGAILARIAIGAALPLVPPAALPRLGGIVIDARVMAFCFGLSLLASLLVGVVPALHFCRVGSEGRALQAGEARATGDGRGERLRTLLVGTQVALTLVLLIGAGLLVHSFVRLTSVSPGFESSGRDGVVQTVKVTLPERPDEGPERIHAFARGVLDRVQRLPGVKSASLVNSAPFGMMFIRDAFEMEGQPGPTVDAGKPKIAAGYFRTMGIPLLAGRDFTERDTADAPKVAIVSERIARECCPAGAGQALGRRVRLSDRGVPGEWLTVVGVVADIRQMGLDRDVQPMIYVPFEQERGALFLRFMVFVVRTSTPAAVVEGVRAEIRRAAPDLPIESTPTMDESLAKSVAEPRFRTLLLALFAIAATLIATCGIYGLMAYAVAQRRREIGVRMALGAERRDVLRLVLARALRVLAGGVTLGLAGAFGVTRVLQRFLFGVTPVDPTVFTIVTLALVAVGLAAAWVPARRATRIDPVAALRGE